MPQPPPPTTTLAHFGGQGFPYGAHLRGKLNRVVGASDGSDDSDPATGDVSDPALHAGASFSAAAATLGGTLTRVLSSERDCLDTNCLERHLPVSFDEIVRSHLGASPSPSASPGASLVGGGGAVRRNSSSISLPRIRTAGISFAENMSISELNARARASSKSSSSSTVSATAGEGDGAGAASAAARTPRSPRSPMSDTPSTPRSPPRWRRSKRSTSRPFADVSDDEEDEDEDGDDDDDSCLSTRVHVVDSSVDIDAMANVDEDNEDFISCEPGAPGGVRALSDPEEAAAAAAVVGGGGGGGGRAAAVERAGYLASAPVSSPMILVAQMVHLW